MFKKPFMSHDPCEKLQTILRGENPHPNRTLTEEEDNGKQVKIIVTRGKNKTKKKHISRRDIGCCYGNLS